MSCRFYGLKPNNQISDDYVSPFKIDYSETNSIFYNSAQHMIEATKTNLFDLVQYINTP